MNVGKTSVAKELALFFKTERLSIDNLRWTYFDEIGYDKKKADMLMKKGHQDLMEYWEPFQGHAVKRMMKDYSQRIIAFGAGFSRYDDVKLFNEVKNALKEHIVIFLNPSRDIELGKKMIYERTENFNDFMKKAIDSMIEHPTNELLADHTIFVENSSPKEVAGQIIELLQNHYPRIEFGGPSSNVNHPH